MAATQERYLVPGLDGAPNAHYNYRGPGPFGDGIERYLSAVIQQRLGSNWNARLAYASVWDTNGSLTNKTAAPVTTTNGSIAYTYNDGTSTTQSVQLDVTSTWNIAGAELKFLAGAAGRFRNRQRSLGQFQPFSYTGWTLGNPATWPVPWPPLTPALSTFTAPTSNSGGESRDGALYTSDMLNLFQKRLHLLGGARVQRVRRRKATNNIAPVSSQGFGENDVTYEAGALYQLTKAIGVYANWSESFLPSKVLRTPEAHRSGHRPARDRLHQRRLRRHSDRGPGPRSGIQDRPSRRTARFHRLLLRLEALEHRPDEDQHRLRRARPSILYDVPGRRGVVAGRQFGLVGTTLQGYGPAGRL